MRRRYERRRAAKTKAAAAEKATLMATTGSSNPLETATSSTAAQSTVKKRQTTVHAAAQIKLHVHGHEFQNGEEIILNPESFPQLKELVWKDYVVEVFNPEHTGDAQMRQPVATDGAAAAMAEGSPQNHLLLEIPESSAAPLKGKLQVSVLKETAAFFQLAPFKDVTVRFLPKTQVEVDFVEVSLKDQFMSRRDLMYLKQSMVGTTLYVGKTIRVQGTRWQVLDVRAGGDKVRSGVISENTKFTFRSRTSRIMWLVQISPEMWDMANSGMLYLEIFLTVVRNVLSKWMKHKVSHSLTILFCSRCFYPGMDQDQQDSSFSIKHNRKFMPRRKQSCVDDDERESSFPYEQNDCFSVGVDENGRHYQDFYKLVVFDSIITDVEPLLVELKKAINEFPRECGWRSPADFSASSFAPTKLSQDEFRLRLGIPSNARNGNLLEAVNLVLNIFEKHHIDRDLSRSGQSVVLITPGNGIFLVNRRLSEITEQRMMDHGIGIDLISLASRPLHKCPLFLFKQSDLSEMKLPGRKDGNSATEMCLCNNNSQGLKNGFQRRSRTGSNEVGTDSQSAVVDMGVSSMRSGQLCKYCLQRMKNRKNYIVPLWIPLWFVQENMLVSHECPLDEDITQFCDVCAPQSLKNKIFEPLPMCRMFKDNDFNYYGYVSLPKPLERLLNGFQTTDLSLSDDDRNNTFNMAPSACGSTGGNGTLTGLYSDLVRARASSMTRSDDSLSYDGEALIKIRAFSLSEQNKLLQEYEKYDDEVFGFAPPPKLALKSSDSDLSIRGATTPPIRPGISFHTSTIKKRAGPIGFHSGSAGNGNDIGSSNSGGTRWRQFEHREPSPLNADMAEYRGSLEAKVGSLGDDKDKARITSSSFPNTFQFGDTCGPSHAAFITSPVLRPAEGAVDEDIFHSQAYMLKQLTSNQRRWSQVRPYEDQRYKIAQNVLKWRSLCFPALLPLASDFMPAPKEIQAHYTESFYSVMLPERDEQNGVMFRDYRELVLEMVAQRLSQDFQLVSVEDSSEVGGKAGTVFRLSMGHRIHEIVFNEETQTIDVKRYLQKVTTRSDVDIMEYRYLLWSPVLNQFSFVSQEFRKYPQIEYQWNHLDQLICGYIDDMSEGIRYKRSLYCLFPPRLGGLEVEDKEVLRDYTEGCRKFLEFLRVKADASTGFPNVKFSTDWRKDISTSGTDAFKRVGQRSVKMLLHTNDAVTSQNWVIAKIDTEVLPMQCYHVEIQWLVCRSSLVDDLITGITRRAKQLGLELQRVTENGISSNLDLHPLNCPIFLKIEDPLKQQEVERALVERFNFCCEALHPIPFTHLNHHAEYAIIAQEPRPPRARRLISYYRQYVHRSLSCFARMTQTGLVWISNQKMHDDEIQPIFDELRQYIDSLREAHSASVCVPSDVIEPAELKDSLFKEVERTDSTKSLFKCTSVSASSSTCSQEKKNECATTNVHDAVVDNPRSLTTIAAEVSTENNTP